MGKLAALRQFRLAQDAYERANDALARVPLNDVTAKGLRDLTACVSALLRTVEELIAEKNSD